MKTKQVNETLIRCKTCLVLTQPRRMGYAGKCIKCYETALKLAHRLKLPSASKRRWSASPK